MGSRKTKGVRISSAPHAAFSAKPKKEICKGLLLRICTYEENVTLHCSILIFFTTVTFQFKISNVALIFFLTYKCPVDNLILVV